VVTGTPQPFNSPITATAWCDAGDMAVGGGGRIAHTKGTGSAGALIASESNSTGSWSVGAAGDFPTDLYKLTPFVVCIRPKAV
jgi:hypothetical protein